ncbi:MAG: radical SAM protein [Deltaproteobacteria bacterium]|nr:radical SAM protein [Deltaproteobacteria bacterium]
MRPPLTLRVHALLKRSYANGPGCRAVVWVQGCSIRCAGCCNPGAQDRTGGRVIAVAEVLAWVRSITSIEGVTLSGGEPLDQPEAVAALLRRVRRTTDFSVILFTGFDWTRVAGTPALMDVARLADVVVAGPYRRRQHLGYALLGSANQTIHLLTDRYKLPDLEAVPEVEVVLDEVHTVLTGVNDATVT